MQRVRNLADKGTVYEAHGDARGAIDKSAKRVSAEYTSLNVTHATMEPQNCTARASTAIASSSGRRRSRRSACCLAAVKGAGFKPENVKINVTFLGGGFGRRAENDYAVDAALIAKAVPGKPVKMIWSREDDIRYTKPRPLVVQRLEAGLDAQGNLTGLHFRVVGESIYRRFAPPAFQASGGKDLPLLRRRVRADLQLSELLARAAARGARRRCRGMALGRRRLYQVRARDLHRGGRAGGGQRPDRVPH